VLGGVFVQVIEKYADALARDIAAAVHLPIEVEPWTIYGIVLIALVYLMPTGIAGGLVRLQVLLNRRTPAKAGDA
jgi:branched-chain amino acid transport system permease protein